MNRAPCALAAVALLLAGAAAADVADGRAQAELAAQQAGERLELRLRQARALAPSRRPGSGERRRIEQEHTVQRMRQQSRHVEARDRLEHRRHRALSRERARIAGGSDPLPDR